jgi:arylsulfatase A-like enzyme
MILKLSVDDFKAHALTLSSPDELSMYIARRLMQQEAPSLLWITMHDIDVAHAGAYSLYIDGIRRTDRLCAELWKAAQSEPEYAGNTTLFILPDFGRDADEDSGGNGFQHHRTGDAASRTTWMMALGAGVRPGVVYDQPMQSIDLVPTLGAMMGFSPSLSRGRPIKELV